jgi:hypothetical protein
MKAALRQVGGAGQPETPPGKAEPEPKSGMPAMPGM